MVSSFRLLRIKGTVVFQIIIFFVSSLSASMPISAALAQEYKVPRISEIRLLRLLGRYDQAISYLEVIINSEGIDKKRLRDAYNEIVSAYIQKGDHVNARSLARDALIKCYDLKIDPRLHPREVGELYSNLLKEQFVPVHIATNPAGASVYIGERQLGNTPLERYMLIGEHIIKIKKEYYKNETLILYLQPGKRASKNLKLSPYMPAPNEGLHFGVKIAISRVWITEDATALGQPTDTKSPFRIAGGVCFSLPVHDKAALQIEGRFVRLGNRAYYYYKSTISKNYNLYHDYLAFPVTFKYYLHSMPALYVTGGFEIAIHLSSKFTDGPISVSRNVNSTNRSLVMGAGAELPIGSRYIIFSGEYFLGLSDVVKRGSNYRTREFRISSGIMY